MQGYDYLDKEKDTLLNVVNIEVIAKNEKEAKAKAKKYLKKPHYRFSGVVEKNVNT